MKRDLLHDLRRLYGHLSRRRRRQLFAVMALMLIGALAELMTLGAIVPFLAVVANPEKAASYLTLPNTFGILSTKHSGQILQVLSAIFAAVALIAGAVRLVLLWASQKFVSRVGSDIGVEVYRRILCQPYSYHIENNTSELIGSINKVQILLLMLNSLLNVAIGLIISCAIIIALLIIDAAVALISVACFGVIYLFISLLTKARLQQNSRIIAQTQGDRVKFIQEGLGGIRDVILDHSQAWHVENFRHVELAFRDAQATNNFIGVAPRFILEAFGMVFIGAIALILSNSEGGIARALPVLGTLALGAQRLLPLMQQTYFGWSQVIGNRQVLFDVLNHLDLPIAKQPIVISSVQRLRFDKEIRIENLSFQYPNAAEASLHEINMSIPKGSRIALVGKSGSGKSTLVDIIMGLLSPTLGQITIDDTVLCEKNIPRWRKCIAHVPQAIYLADACVAENIAIGSELNNVNWQDINAAIRKANLADFVDSLPSGYQTLVGERGARLSGGQRQRIGIARALYKNADVLILDEATSALDTASERAVMSVIDELSGEKTVIIIAHRLSTIERCNRLVVLDKGRIVGCGTYEELLQENLAFQLLASGRNQYSRS